MSKSASTPPKAPSSRAAYTKGEALVSATEQQVVVPAGEHEVRLDVQVTAIGASMRKQAFFWLFATIIFVLFLTVFSSILLPFVAGLALAYFLDPVADRL